MKKKNYCFEIYYLPYGDNSDSKCIAARFSSTIEKFNEIFRNLGCIVPEHAEDCEHRELFSSKIGKEVHELVCFDKMLHIGVPYFGFDCINFEKNIEEIKTKISETLMAEYGEKIDIDEIDIPEVLYHKLQEKHEEKLCYIDCPVYIGEGENYTFFDYTLDEREAKMAIEHIAREL